VPPRRRSGAPVDAARLEAGFCTLAPPAS